METHLILIDFNNIGFQSMASPKLSAGDKETNGTFTFIKKVREIYLENPDSLIMFLHDGKSWRKDLFEGYKASRESTDKKVEARNAYYEQKKDMRKALTLLGAIQVSCGNYEADDLAEYYSKRWKGDKVTLVTRDGDWLQLVDAKTSWLDPITRRTVTLENFKEFTGFKDSAQFVEAKSILGDKDEVPGIKGIGPAKLEVIYKQLNMSFREFMDWHIAYPTESREEWFRLTGKKMPKIVSDLACVDTFVQLDFNDKLGDLRTKHRPEPIRLNIKQKPLDVAGFEEFCYTLGFMSVTRNLDKFVKPYIDNKYIR